MKEYIIKTKRTTNYIYSGSEKSFAPMVFLHGFSGTHKSWAEILAKLGTAAIAVDLPGHGKSTFNNLESEYNIDMWCEDFSRILDFLDLERVSLCGYSMGGRLAISFAIKYPEKISSLILESASCGINDAEDRRERFQKDLELCSLIERDLPEFIQKWENNELFLKQRDRNPQGFLTQRKERLLHNPKQLSKALKSFSQGAMGCYEEEFSKFKFPVTLINGSEDFLYIEKGRMLSRLSPHVNHCIIDEVGHNIHLENPAKFIDCLK